MEQKLERVCNVARLARLDLTQGMTEAEAKASLELFAQQFDDIIDFMNTLAEVNTDGVEPLYWPLSFPPAPPREDIARKDHTREELLANAPQQDGRFFVVPKIV